MNRWRLLSGIALGMLVACGDDPAASGVEVPGRLGAVKSTAEVRAARRLFDGAPPVIAHDDFGAACISCHNPRGMNVPGIGFAPPPPHRHTTPPSAMSRCRQCHVFAETETLFRASSFIGLRQDLRKGKRQNKYAPPVIPHQILLRENCQACHDGPAAREEIRCSHPQRQHCRQCHLETRTNLRFKR